MLCAVAAFGGAIWKITRPSDAYIGKQYAAAAEICETDVNAGGSMIADLDRAHGKDKRPDGLGIGECSLSYVVNQYRDLEGTFEAVRIASETEEPRIPISQLPQ